MPLDVLELHIKAALRICLLTLSMVLRDSSLLLHAFIACSFLLLCGGPLHQAGTYRACGWDTASSLFGGGRCLVCWSHQT